MKKIIFGLMTLIAASTFASQDKIVMATCTGKFNVMGTSKDSVKLVASIPEGDDTPKTSIELFVNEQLVDTAVESTDKYVTLLNDDIMIQFSGTKYKLNAIFTEGKALLINPSDLHTGTIKCDNED